MARRAAKVDSNQAEIVDALRALGFHVMLTHTLGQGAPDIVVTGYSDHTDSVKALLVEIKSDKGKLTHDEATWHAAYPDDGPLIVARDVGDVLAWFGRQG